MSEDIVVKNEITNAVLATKLDGFKELTDTKFKNIEDTLKRIEGSNAGFITKAEVEEIKKDFNKSVEEIKQGFIKHNEDDKVSFGGLDKGQRDLRDTIKTWGGVIATIAVILPFIVPLVLHYVFRIA